MVISKQSDPSQHPTTIVISIKDSLSKALLSPACSGSDLNNYQNVGEVSEALWILK